MGDHFTLDIHPHRLRAAAHSLDLVRQSLVKHAKTSTDQPGTIGTKWTGYAATSVTSEMTAVGGHLDTFANQLLHCSTALTTLAGHYEKAQATLTELNTKWAKTETDYQSACDDADSAYQKSYDGLKGPNGAPPNRGLTSDLQDSRSFAKLQASHAQMNAQSGLETDFATLKTHLTTQTVTCGTALSTNIPIKNLGMCTADNPTGLDHSNLLTDLTLVSEYEDLKQQNADDQAAADAAAPEIAALQKALEGNDPQAIEDALKAIQGHVNGPYGSDYSKAMLDALGSDPGAVAKAVNTIFNNLDWAIRKNEADPNQQKDEILALTDGLANGLSQYSDGDYGKFYGTLADMDRGAAQLALIASSGYADARQTSGALALQSRWYHYPSGSRELFPEMFQYAYDPPQDMVKLLASRSNADALATDLENVDPGKLDYLLESLTLVNRGDRNMTDDEANIQYDLFTQTIEVLKNRFINSSDHDGVPSTALVHALQVAKNGHWGSDDLTQRQDLDDKLLGELTSIINDGDFVRTYLDQSLRDPGAYSKTLIADLLHATHADSKDLINNLITSEIALNKDPKQVATLIGNLMRDGDLADMGLDWKGAGLKGLEEALSDGLSKVAETNPVTGFLYGPFKAIIDDLSEQQGKIDEAYKGWNDAAVKDTVQHELALALYVKAHADDPAFGKDFSDYMNRPDLAGNPSAANRYYEQLMDQGGKTADELREYADIINGSRDDN